MHLLTELGVFILV